MLSVPQNTEDLSAELHDRFWKRLVCFAARRVPDSAVAEDVAQEALRRVFEALQNRRIENLDALPAFVFQTARNICMHYGRSARRERGALLRFSSGALVATAEDEHPLRQLVSRERVEALRRAVAQLDQADRDLLQLLYVDALETAEIARRLGIDSGATRVRKHRLLKRLAQFLEESPGNVRPQTGTKEVNGE